MVCTKGSLTPASVAATISIVYGTSGSKGNKEYYKFMELYTDVIYEMHNLVTLPRSSKLTDFSASGISLTISL